MASMRAVPGSPAPLAATTAADVTGWITSNNEDLRVICRVASDTTFRLNLLSSSDGGATNYVIKQVASSTVTVDGATSGYVRVAELDVPWPAVGNIQVYNPSGGEINWIADYRIYRGGH
jgi:hypothetical protein